MNARTSPDRRSVAGLSLPEFPAPEPTGPFAGTRYRSAIVGSYALIAALVSLSYFWQAAQIDASVSALAHERGTVLFRLIELTRDWNAQHGGVYVPVTGETQPNPYLELPRRDVTTTDGQQLTLVNPSFMTRQISELAAQADGVRFHITSEKLVRPANKADPWEAESLRAFSAGQMSERLDFFAAGGGILDEPVHRYMAPLRIKEACLKCHDQQGYRIGDVRGGISITMPAGSLLDSAARQRTRLALASLAACALLGALAHLALWLFRRNLSVWQARERLQTLETITRDQEALIAQRTQELSTANAALAAKVAEAESALHQLEESQASYRSVVEASQNGIIVLRNDEIVFVNARMEEILGRRGADIMKMGLAGILGSEERAIVAERQHRGQGVVESLRVRLQHKDGLVRRTADVQVGVWQAVDGATHLVLNFKDVTAKLSAEHDLAIAGAVFERAAEGILVTDRDGRIVHVNPAFTVLTGYSVAEAIGNTPRLLKSGQHDAAFYAQMWNELLQDGRWEGEIWNRRKNGDVFAESLRIARIPADESWDGGFVATFNDITLRKEAENLIRHQANHDPLTNLANRRLFDKRLEMALTRARLCRSPLALLYMDLDHFKEVNDTFGHATGDALLREAAQRMLRCVRSDDTVARFGGDEFAIILGELRQPQDAFDVARRMLEALARPFALDGRRVLISASIGIALHPEDGAEAANLRARADAALYAAKAAGRNCWRGGEPGAALPAATTDAEAAAES
ncbi:diguanylate cyclase domain-containing protein [Rhodocyclus purpureus]|uniref:diguanylate cyclase domain-containing protein n=1 Tax=Rhodocyclus purpureus TaxID=1067 RepID=UPI00191306A9|nr:diguanylate cyclase [Rhodocyclus purpureus]